MRSEWKVKNGKAMQQKCAVVDLCVAARIDNHLARLELPFGVRQFASSDSAVIDQVVIGAGLLDSFSSEGKRSGGSQDGPVSVKTQPSSSGHIVKTSRFKVQIVSPARRSYMVVVRAAVEREVSRRRRFLGLRIVSRFIRPQDVGSVVNLYRPMQLINSTFLFLLDGANCVDLTPLPLSGGRHGAGCCWSSWLARGRAGAARSRIIICRWQLAGN